MTLQSSGVITVGDINVELKKARNAAFNINSAEARTLAKVPSGVIKMSDFYGKSTYPASGTLLSNFCDAGNYYGQYANGNGGSYNTLLEGNSWTYCGWVQPAYEEYFDSYGHYVSTIPAHVRYVSISICGGGGGAGGGDGIGGTGGFSGGKGIPYQFVLDTLVYGAITAARTLDVYVGGGGGGGQSNNTNGIGGNAGLGYPNGGIGGNGYKSGGGGGGGGGTKVVFNGTLVAFAGGGGGGGGRGQSNLDPTFADYFNGGWTSNGFFNYSGYVGDNGFNHTGDGGGGGGGGGGAGYGVVCISGGETATLPGGYNGGGQAVNWGRSDTNGPGGGSGSHWGGSGISVSSESNYVNGAGVAGAPNYASGSWGGSGGDGHVRIMHNSSAIRQAGNGVYDTIFTKLQMLVVQSPPVVNNCCFPKGSMVLMGDSTWKAIELVTVGNMVMSADGPTEVVKFDTPLLGSRRLLRFAGNETFKWSEEHGIWSKRDEKQWWWSANPDMWRNEALYGAIGGLLDNSTMRNGTRDTTWAHLDGWLDGDITDVPATPETMLYLPITNGKPIIVEGYLVGASINESLYDYNLIDWDANRVTINNTLPQKEIK